jgi:hypothetical protein
MRNWRWMRKGGGAEDSFDVRSLAASKGDAVEDDAATVMAMTTGNGFAGDGVEANVAL